MFATRHFAQILLTPPQDWYAIREVDLSDGGTFSVRTIAGTGSFDTGSSAPAPALEANILYPEGIAVLPDESALFFADSNGMYHFLASPFCLLCGQLSSRVEIPDKNQKYLCYTVLTSACI
jgi:hypothetical protein